MTSAKNTTSSNGKTEDDTNVTPIVPEQKTETAKEAAEVFVEAEKETSKIEKLKALAKKNQRVLIAAGITTVTTLLVLNSRRKYLAAEVEETEEPTQA